MEKMGDQLPSLPKLRWQCRRGMLELDILLTSFLEGVYPTLPQAQQKDFVELLNTPDQSLFQWLIGGSEPADNHLKKMVTEIRMNAKKASVAEWKQAFKKNSSEWKYSFKWKK